MHNRIQRAIDSNLSGLYVTPGSRARILSSIQGGQPMKKKLSLALATALSALLVTAALAAVILGGKDIVDQKISPMAQNSASQRFTKEEVEDILAFAQKHGIQLDDNAVRRIRDQGSCFKEELALLFAKEQLGFYPGTWDVADQYWYAQFWQQLHPDLLVESAVPQEGELTQDEIEQRAAQYIKGQYGGPDVLDKARYRISRSFTEVKQTPWYTQRQWALWFEPLTIDDPSIHMELSAQGDIEGYRDDRAEMQGTPEQRAQLLLDRFHSLYGNIYGSQDAWSAQNWQDLHNRLKALGLTPGTNREADYILAQNYTAPAGMITREQAMDAAAGAVSAAHGVSKEKLLDTTQGKYPPETAVHAIYLEAQGQQRWKVSFAWDYLAEVDAKTGQVVLTDVFSPGNDHRRRYVLDILIPQERRAFATKVPQQEMDIEATYPPQPYFTEDLSIARPGYWQQMRDIGLNTHTADAIYNKLYKEYGHDPTYWPIVYQAIHYLRYNKPALGDVFPGVPEATDMQQDAALQLARDEVKSATNIYSDAYIDSLEPVIQFTFNLYTIGSRTWQIRFVEVDGRDIREIARVDLDAIEDGKCKFIRVTPTGRAQEVSDGILPADGEIWSTMGTDGRPLVWRNPIAPEHYWAFMEKHYNTREDVEKALANWQKKDRNPAAFYSLEQKAVISLWRHQDQSEDWMREHIELNGIPGEGDLTEQQAEERAWDALIKAGVAHSRAESEATRANCNFIYTNRYNGQSIWQIEFLDERTDYSTSFGLVKLDGQTGEVLEVVTGPGNG